MIILDNSAFAMRAPTGWHGVADGAPQAKWPFDHRRAQNTDHERVKCDGSRSQCFEGSPHLITFTSIWKNSPIDWRHDSFSVTKRNRLGASRPGRAPTTAPRRQLSKEILIYFPLYIIRHKSADLTELASIVHPYGSTISSLLKFADGDPLHLSEVKQLWANTATVELQVETHHYLSNGEIAVGGVFTLSINLQESIAELYDAVTVAVLDSAPAIDVNISIFFSGRYLNAFSDQPLFLAQLQSHSQIEACIYYPAAPADAIVVRVNTFIITLIVIKIDWHTDPDIWTRTHRRRKKKKMMIMMRIAMKK